MKVGFTGTRKGMTDAQHSALADWIDAHPSMAEFHHGDCVGADAESHVAVLCWSRAHIFVHPPVDDSLAATCAGGARVTRLPRKTYFARNRDIVDACDVLLACPMEKWTTLPNRGGTAYTVGYARKCGKLVVIFWPDGTVSEEGGK